MDYADIKPCFSLTEQLPKQETVKSAMLPDSAKVHIAKTYKSFKSLVSVMSHTHIVKLGAPEV